MKFGFYYHIPVCKNGKQLLTAGYLGCFLDALASEVEELVLFMHEAESEDQNMDYKLRAENIRYVSLGIKPHALWRTFLGDRLILPIRHQLAECDLMLVRGPTPLLQAWGKACRSRKINVVPLLVGDYQAGNANLNFAFPKQQIVKFLNWWVDRQERRLLIGKSVLVNSSALSRKYRPIASKVYEVRTTTLSEHSFFEREDTCGNDEINILYTGRFDWQKGLQELFDAFVELVVSSGVNAKLNFAGWQNSRGESIESMIMEQAASHGLSDRVIFHGRKKVGPELDTLYRMADIYVLPSYAEGFPRTIWEAMANSCPVVATRVGGIPALLVSEQHALLVEPRDAKALFHALLKVITKKRLRQEMIVSGRNLASENTLEVRVRELISSIDEIMKGD